MQANFAKKYIKSIYHANYIDILLQIE